MIDIDRFHEEWKKVKELRKSLEAQNNRVRHLALKRPDVLLALLLSGDLDEDSTDYTELMCIGGNPNLVGIEENAVLIPLFEQLREHRDQLPEHVGWLLDWYDEIHGY